MTGTHTPPAYRRRAVLRAALGGAAAAATGAVLAACGGEASPTTAPAATTARPSTAATVTSMTPAASPAATTVAATSAPATAATTVATSAATTGGGAMMTRAPSPAVGMTGGTAALPPSALLGGPLNMPDADGKIASPGPGVPDAYLRPPKPFKSVQMTPPGRGGRVTVVTAIYGPAATAKGSNQYWQYLDKLLGVSWEMNQVPAGSYQEKFAALVASGDLPDLCLVDAGLVPDYGRLIQQGVFTDLTPFLTGDGLKEFPNLAAFGDRIWKNVAIGGKVYGVPRPRFLAGSTLMFRQDWAEKVGIPAPKNAEEFFNLMTAFTKMDPDGNGRADSYGMSANAPRPNFGIDGFFAAMFRAPNNWRLNPDGTLTKDYETEEFKQAVDYARRLWAAGLYAPDSPTQTIQQAKDAFVAGKFGGYTDGITALPNGTTGLRKRTAEIVPTAKAVGLVPFGHDGGKPAYRLGLGFFGFAAINARTGRDREKVREILRVLDFIAAPIGSEESIALAGIEGVHYTVRPDGTRVATDRGSAERSDLTGIASAAAALSYADAPMDAPYMQGLIRDLIAVGVDDPTFVASSSTNNMRGGELAQLYADRVTAIVLEREPLSAWDQFVRDWRSRGGDAIKKEFQDSIKSA